MSSSPATWAGMCMQVGRCLPAWMGAELASCHAWLHEQLKISGDLCSLLVLQTIQCYFPVTAPCISGNVIVYSGSDDSTGLDGDWFGGLHAGNAEAFLDALLKAKVWCYRKGQGLSCRIAWLAEIATNAAAVSSALRSIQLLRPDT